MARDKVAPKKVAPKKSSFWKILVAIPVAILLLAGAMQIRNALREASDAKESQTLSAQLDTEIQSGNNELQDAQAILDTIVQDVDAIGLDKARANHKDDGKKASESFVRVKASFHHAGELARQLKAHTSSEAWQEFFATKAEYYATYEQLGETDLQLAATLFDPSITDSKALLEKLRDGVQKRNGLLKQAKEQLRAIKAPEKPH